MPTPMPAPETIRLTVNGQPREVAGGTTVSDLVRESKLTADQVAVEVNRKLRRASEYDTPLADGDVVEIVTFVGGG